MSLCFCCGGLCHSAYLLCFFVWCRRYNYLRTQVVGYFPHFASSLPIICELSVLPVICEFLQPTQGQLQTLYVEPQRCENKGWIINPYIFRHYFFEQITYGLNWGTDLLSGLQDISLKNPDNRVFTANKISLLYLLRNKTTCYFV